MFKLLSTRTPGSTLPSCFAAGRSSARTGTWGWSSSRPGFNFFPLVNLRLISDYFSSLPGPSGGMHSHLVYQLLLPNFVSSTNLLRVNCAPSSRSWKETEYWLQYQPLGYTSRHRPPAGLCAADNKVWNPAVQPVFSSLHGPIICSHFISSWGCCGRQCGKLCWSQDKLHPILSLFHVI